MNERKLSGKPFCQAFMSQIVSDIFIIAQRRADWLRFGPTERWEADLGKHVLPLRSLPLTEEHITMLEMAFREVQESILGSLFALIDGSSQPPGWPDEIRLMNTDTMEVICPEGLQWAFGLALADYRGQLGEHKEGQDESD